MIQGTGQVVARNVGKRFANGVEALRGIDLEVGAGEFVSIVGPSGCGKSTLRRLIAGLTRATSGTLTIAGLPPPAARRRRQDLAYVFQDPTLLPWRTVAKNVALPLELRGHNRAETGSLVERALEMVGLADFARAHEATVLMSESMDEIVVGTREINSSVTSISEISNTNREMIGEIVDRVALFEI